MVDGERSWDPAIERPVGGGVAAADDVRPQLQDSESNEDDDISARGQQ